MSCYFESESGTLWNPGNSIGLLFLGYAEALEKAYKLTSGIGSFIEDESWVDVERLADFCRQLAARALASENSVPSLLVRDFLLIASILLERGGVGFKPEFSDPSRAEGWDRDFASLGQRMPR